MEDLKKYTPGLYDATVREKQRQQEANIAAFKTRGYNLYFTRDVLDAIDMPLIPFMSNGKIGFMNGMCNIVIEPIYDEIRGVFRSNRSYVAVRKGKVWNIINHQGIELLEEEVRSTIKPGYDCPLATIQNQSKSKVINVLTKKTIVNGGYNYIGGFRYGFARVRVGNNSTGKWGIIDENGILVLPTEYVAIYPFYDYPKPTTKLKLHKESLEELISLGTLK